MVHNGDETKDGRPRHARFAWRTGITLLLLAITVPFLVAAVQSLVTYGYIFAPARTDDRLRSPKSIEHTRIVYTSKGVVQVSRLQQQSANEYAARSIKPRHNPTPYQGMLGYYGGSVINPLIQADESTRPPLDGLFEKLVQANVLKPHDFDPTIDSSFEGAVIDFTSQEGQSLVGVMLTVYGPDIYHGRMVEAILTRTPSGWRIEHARTYIDAYANEDEAPKFRRKFVTAAILVGIPLALLGLLMLLLRWIVPGFRHKGGCCQSCGYSVAGLTDLKCPECGTSFDADSL